VGRLPPDKEDAFLRALDVSESPFYEWHYRRYQPTPNEQRRAEVDAAATEVCAAAYSLHHSPRISDRLTRGRVGGE
jgi:hypothetical protein